MIKHMKIIIVLLKWGGVLVVEDRKERYMIFFLTFLNALVNFYSIVGSFLEGVINGANYEKGSFLLYSMLLSEVFFSKMYYLLARHKEVQYIFNFLETDILVRNELTEQEQDRIKKIEASVRYYTTVYWIGSLGGCFAVCSSPLFEKLFKYLNLIIPRTEKRYPFPMYVWFDDSVTVHYVLWYLVGCSLSLSLMCVWIGTDMLFAALIGFYRIHFKILKDRILELSPGNDSPLGVSSVLDCSIGRPAETEIVNEKIKKVVNYHRDLLILCDKLEAIFSPQLLHLVLSNTVVLCTCGFQISVGSLAEASHLFAMALSVVNLTSSWFLYCYIGSVMEGLGDELAEAIYFTDWLSLPVSEKKNMMFMLARMQKRIRFTAGKFLKLSLASFVVVMRMCYSLIAVLRQAYKE